VHAFQAQLWLHDDEGGWTFLTVPPEVSDDVRELTAGSRGGFGSVRVEATVGGTPWRTSLFPDRRRGAYVLPVKKPVRVSEQVEAGDTVQVRLRVLEDGHER